MCNGTLGSLKGKWNYLSNHPGFRQGPALTLSRLISWRARCALGIPATIDLPTWGVQMFLPPKWTGAGTTMIYAVRETYEPELTYLGRFVSAGNVVVDAGASCGIYTLAASKLVMDSGRVFSFEPGAESFSVLKRNVELNGLRNVRPFPVALSDTEGKARLHHHPHGPNSFSLGAHADWSGSFEETETTSLDRVAEQERIDRVDLLKMDVEGAEELVLRGARSLLTTNRPVVIFEVNPKAARRLGLSADGAWDLMGKLGYHFHRLNGVGSLSKLEFPPHGGNVVAIHPRSGK